MIQEEEILSYIEITKNLRKQLHQYPELAFEERKTKGCILHFLRTYTNLEMGEEDQWIYAKWTGKPLGRTLAFRADFDAVSGSNGVKGHFCGHDGHAAVLCGFAKYVSDQKPEDTIYFIFQPAEETGQGGKICSRFLKEWKVDAIFGFHNIPGYPLGNILLRKGTFACASTGLEIHLKGSPSHAAYPEAGKNPSFILAEIMLKMKEWMERKSRGMLLGTVIGVEIGSDAYGVSADEGILRLTIRGEYQDEFEALLNQVKTEAKRQADQQGFEISLQEVERFPATENHRECVDMLRQCASHRGLIFQELEGPFRWSEDFGYYLQEGKGAFFGVGDGEGHPQLHTESYEFPDEIIPYVFRMYQAIILE